MPSSNRSRAKSCASLASYNMTGTIGLSPSLMSNPASFSSPRQYFAFHSSLSRRSVVAVISSSTFSAPATITGATELENRNGRARWRHISTNSRRPLTQPPDAPPSALPSVVVITSIFPKTPQCSWVPRPVRPMKPLACESSRKTIASYFSASSTISASFAMSPSMEKTPSVMIMRERLSMCSCSFSSKCPMSECLNVSCMALHRRIPSTMEACLNEQDVMIADRLVHASIVDGMRLCKVMQDTFKHSDMGHLEEKLQEHMDKRSRMIITDGVFSMDGDMAKLDEIVELAEKYDAMVFLDDSHASGFIGRTGRGTHEHRGVLGKIDVITTTLGKALGGASGGCVSGRRELVEMCRQRARPFLFSNSVAPVIVAGALKVLELITATTDRRDKLEWNAKYWRGLLKDAGFDIKEGESPIVPVMLYDAKLAQDFARDLFDEGIYAVGFFFPVVAKGQARIRTQLSAAHEKHHLDVAIEAFKKVGKKHAVLGLGKKELLARAGA